MKQTKNGQLLMTNDEIKSLYDSNLNLTLAGLARLTGKTINELKQILMEG